MTDAPYSKEFDDVYFSPSDGLAETRHVFLDGNGLPEAWAGRDEFVIFETGFGTGLNFLAAWQLFEETAKSGQRLHFISVEKYPLKVEEIRDALSGFGFRQLDMFLDWYSQVSSRAQPRDLRSFDFAQDDIRLTLHIGDVNAVMLTLDDAVDCWFLDGFRPSSNPEMWSDVVFENMARMSSVEARLATFTAAGFVRRGLQAVGFEVKKVPGFGRKREMLVGRFQDD